MSTIKDVARLAGVSVSTVSRVLNNSKPVNSDVRDRVLIAIDELGYRPNSVARTLVNKKSQLIGVVIPDIDNPFFSALVRGVEEEAKKKGYSILLCNTGGDLEQEIQYLDILKEKYAAGVVFLTARVQDEHVSFFRESKTPVVFACQPENLAGGFSSVAIDDFRAAYEGTSYLIKREHKNIGFVSGPLSDSSSGVLRVEGFKQALIDNGIDFRSEWLYEGNYRYRSGYTGGLKILQQLERPTAIFCANDEMAVGLLSAARELDLSVPEKLSVLGFDDTVMAEIANPKLTTIRQPICAIGKYSAHTLIGEIEGGVEKQHLLLEYEIVERGSCKSI